MVEKRTVITTKRITTSTIRDDRSQRKGSRDENTGRHMSHERTSREVQRYTKSSQDRVADTSSDDELVQRDQEPIGILRSPSPTGNVSLWAPRKKAGRPRLHHRVERSDRQRRLPRREKRVATYDANGQKIRKQRSDRGIPRVPEHLRKTPFKNKYATDFLGSESSTLEAPPAPDQRPALCPARTDSSASIPTTTSEEVPRAKTANPIIFARNTVDKSYDFSDEEDDALPPRLTALPSLLTASSTDTFLGQDTEDQITETLSRNPYEAPQDHFEGKLDGTTFEAPQSPPLAYSEHAYLPSPLGQFISNIDHGNCVAPTAPMAHMETLHQFLPFEDDTSGFMDTYLSFPATSPQEQQDGTKSLETAPIVEPSKYESENDLSIPIDPALLALDAENRAASLERAEATTDPTDEPGMEGTPVPMLRFEELANLSARAGAEEDTDEDLFASQAQLPAFFEDAIVEHDSSSSDDDDDLEDFLMPVQRPSTIFNTNEIAPAKESRVDDAIVMSPFEETSKQIELSTVKLSEGRILDLKKNGIAEDVDKGAWDDVESGNICAAMAASLPAIPFMLATSSEAEAPKLNKEDLPAETAFSIVQISSIVAAGNDTITAAAFVQTGLRQSVAASPIEKGNPAADVTQPSIREKSPSTTAIAPRSVVHDTTILTGEQQPEAAVVWKEPSPISAVTFSRWTEVPDSDADSEDELLTQPSSQPVPFVNVSSSQPNSAHSTPRSVNTMKRVRFAVTVFENNRAKSKVLPPPAWSPLTDEEEMRSQKSSSPSWQLQVSDDPIDAVEEVDDEDDEDDIALLPASPVVRQKATIKPVPSALSVPSRPSQTATRSTSPVSHSAPVPAPRVNSRHDDDDDDELATPKSILKRPSRSTTPRPASTRGSPGSHVSRATPTRLFSLSVSPQSKPRPKLRASLLSESASTTPHRSATPTPPPQHGSLRNSRTSGRLLSASPVPTTTLSGVKISRCEIQARVRAGHDNANDEEIELVTPSLRRRTPEYGEKERSASAEMPESERRCGERGFRCQRTICFKCRA